MVGDPADSLLKELEGDIPPPRIPLFRREVEGVWGGGRSSLMYSELQLERTFAPSIVGPPIAMSKFDFRYYRR